ncbi:MAG: DUF423 domain-containing protein [Verrucomicrobiales bacterium]|nr:DUF423 domain-containing protein [Verrucomicrobiales bacterium]
MPSQPRLPSGLPGEFDPNQRDHSQGGGIFRVGARMAAVLALLAVALGAMGAHALKETLEATPKALDNWRTAAQYHLVHAVALYFLALRPVKCAWWLLFAGTVLFSGSLYLWCLTQVKFLVHLTPVGGLALIAGWLVLACKLPRTSA